MSKAALLGLTLAVLVLSFGGLRAHVANAPYDRVVAYLAEGRSDPADLDWLGPFLAQAPPARCVPGPARTRGLLSLYAVDLTAAEVGLGPFAVSNDPSLTAARLRAGAMLREALACNPHDGDLWLRLAVLERSLEVEPALVAEHVARSLRTSPHEARMMLRRARAFPDLLASSRSAEQG
jgi:hypothetical protein